MQDSPFYSKLGASSSKQSVYNALGQTDSKTFFCELLPDFSGDANYFSLLHADGAGTKAAVAYLAYKATGDVSWFRSLAADSLVMNLDDIACVNAFESLALSNTIGRNRSLIPDTVIKEIITGYREVVSLLQQKGIDIKLAGGETADLGDIVKTLVVDSTIYARVKRDNTLSFDQVKSGDVIVGLSSSGKCWYEKQLNSGIGSNGLTLARHALLNSATRDKNPEICDPSLAADQTYRGRFNILDKPAELGGLSIAEALLSPTRTYAPLIKRVAKTLGSDLHAALHLTGGAHTKVLRFGSGKHYIKDNLFNPPPIFSLIKSSLDISAREMYAVFNMGSRMELFCAPDRAAEIVAISSEFEIEARIVGRVELNDSPNNRVTLLTQNEETITYNLSD
jgi:phosphoribosylformylglycinamidine cyclo-ligase